MLHYFVTFIYIVPSFSHQGGIIGRKLFISLFSHNFSFSIISHPRIPLVQIVVSLCHLRSYSTYTAEKIVDENLALLYN